MLDLYEILEDFNRQGISKNNYISFMERITFMSLPSFQVREFSEQAWECVSDDLINGFLPYEKFAQLCNSDEIIRLMTVSEQ